jgi:biotin transport system substrate-specific component
VNTKRLIRISMMTAILAILSQINIPLAQVPFTLQTLGILLCGFILGPIDGPLSVLIYLLLGAAGVPVFAGLKGGLNILFGATGGFLFSFLIVAMVSGYASQRQTGKFNFYIVGLICILINYAIGVPYLAFYLNIPLEKALGFGFYPFIIPDLIKMIIAVNIGLDIKRRLAKLQ